MANSDFSHIVNVIFLDDYKSKDNMGNSTSQYILISVLWDALRIWAWKVYENSSRKNESI